MTILLFLLLLLLHLHLHLPKTLCSECWKGLFHRLWKRAAHFHFGKGFGLGLVRAESQKLCLPSDFYRRGLVLAPCLHRASPPAFQNTHEAHA
jgi:hypothetical protein